MCPHRHWFMTYEKKPSGNILIGNDAPCKSVGIHDEAKILSFQIFQALDNSYEESDRKDSKMSYN